MVSLYPQSRSRSSVARETSSDARLLKRQERSVRAVQFDISRRVRPLSLQYRSVSFGLADRSSEVSLQFAQ